jgi:hypothetical protein
MRRMLITMAALGGLATAAGTAGTATAAERLPAPVAAPATVTHVQYYAPGYGYGPHDWRARAWAHERWRRHVMHERWRERRAYRAGVAAGRYGY